MNEVFATALEIQSFCEQRHWRFCFIGGIAVHRWGEPRVTDDVDLTLLTGFGTEEAFAEELLKHFRGRRADSLDFALHNRVLLLVGSQGTPIDLALGAIPFEARAIERSTIWLAGGLHALRTCSAEDLVTHKCFAGRDDDWIDVQGILARQWGRLNLELIRTELRPLLELKGQPESLGRLAALIDRQRTTGSHR
ncbi:MAG: hypothetical protein FJ398_19135 [Verrucomicrobia bacterium]|nr:hypothetical protein [Verrucomicrobiota bacterium]